MPQFAIGLRQAFGTTHIVVYLTWDEVLEILGHEHSGSAADDTALSDWLAANGAPEWVAEAPGWMDEGHWGLTGPVVSDEEVTEFQQAYS